ncbi:MAG: hypothetical protein EXS05_15885 [Planctomycetaceae bacterium]|nr:hypothetical protein [Planctomycetaceae bacterium]
MATDDPFALFITWTCYGTWLPGDERGYVAHTLLQPHGFLPRQNTPGTPYAKDNAYTRQIAKALQKGETVNLTFDQAMCVARSLVDSAVKRQWRILRAAIMANHVHLVVIDCPDDGPGVRRVFKGGSQAVLTDELGISRRWWTTGGSDRYLHKDEAIEGAIKYVAEQEYKLVEIIDMQIIAMT